jgi:ABC-type glycerol-3-phosphate transport system substrate-binding protein
MYVDRNGPVYNKCRNHFKGGKEMINTKLKKAAAVTLVSAMAVSSLAACSSSSSSTDAGTTTTAAENNGGNSDETPAADDGSVTDAAKMEAPSTEGWDDSKKIYLYSWDDDFQKKVQYVLDANPELADYVEFVITGDGGTSADYRQKVDVALEGTDKYPSLIAADNDVAKYWSEDLDKVATLSSIGLTSDMYANAYDFSTQYATYNGELTAMTWQATPGSFLYRRDIAQEVFGVSDPEDVQALVKDWDTFMDTAEKLKEAGYYIVSGADDVKYAIWDTQSSAWVQDKDGVETLTLDNAVTEYLETAKKLYDNGYVDTESKMWESAWYNNMSDKAFGYFGCPWFGSQIYNNSKQAGSAATDDKEEVLGEWGAVVGPTSYHWGGTYVMVGKNTNNPELAAYILYELCCDPEIMYNISKGTGDFVNNKVAVQNLINDGVGAQYWLAGQNPFEVWADAALTINLSNVTYADATIKSYIDSASEGYNNGTYATIDDAVNYIKDQAKTELGLAVE